MRLVPAGETRMEKKNPPSVPRPWYSVASGAEQPEAESRFYSPADTKIDIIGSLNAVMGVFRAYLSRRQVLIWWCGLIGSLET